MRRFLFLALAALALAALASDADACRRGRRASYGGGCSSGGCAPAYGGGGCPDGGCPTWMPQALPIGWGQPAYQLAAPLAPPIYGAALPASSAVFGWDAATGTLRQIGTLNNGTFAPLPTPALRTAP